MGTAETILKQTQDTHGGRPRIVGKSQITQYSKLSVKTKSSGGF